MLHGDVVDQFHDEYGLADSGAAEQADLAAPRVRREEVDDLDPGGERLDLGGLVDECRRFPVNGVFFFRVHGSHLVDRVADDVQDAAEGLPPDRHRDLLAGIDGVLAANQTIGGIHGDGSDDIFTEMLGNFQHQVILLVIDRWIGNPERIVNRRQLARLELYVDNRTDDLRYFPDVLTHVTCSSCGLCEASILYA